MGNMRPIDSAVVKNETYDVLSADTMGGEYIETIGAACQNPDGYTSGSLFLGKDNDVQHLYRATAAIAFGETIILDTNCVYTTVSGELEGKAEESEVTSLNEALANTKDSVTSIDITGSTNNTGSTIVSGTFFYLNGALVRAKTSIANGATLTLNTNYELVTVGGLNALNNDLTPVDVSNLFTPSEFVSSVLVKSVFKCGKVIQGTIVFSLKAASWLQNMTMFNIDSSIMPSSTTHAFGYVRKGGEASEQPLLAMFEIHSIGVIRVPNNAANHYIGSITSADFIAISISYISK